MKIPLWGPICAFLLIFVATSANAVLYRGTISGVWSPFINPVFLDYFSSGDSFEVNFEYDSDATVTEITAYNKTYGGAVSSISLESGLFSEEILGADIRMYDHQFVAEGLDDNSDFLIVVNLDSTSTIFPDMALPTTLNLSDFDFAQQVILGRDGGPSAQGWIETLSLTSVPVPPAIWLFASGLLGLIGISRKKA